MTAPIDDLPTHVVHADEQSAKDYLRAVAYARLGQTVRLIDEDAEITKAENRYERWLDGDAA